MLLIGNDECNYLQLGAVRYFVFKVIEGEGGGSFYEYVIFRIASFTDLLKSFVYVMKTLEHTIILFLI